MGDGGEGSKSSNPSMENLSLETKRFSRDLLQRLMGSGSKQNEFEEVVKRAEEDEEEEGDIELSLGLSLGGRFGVDTSSTKLMRSSSIAACLPVVRDDDALAPPRATVYNTLARTSSLPVETEEEWRKRKEMQTLRRMEAKRRRSEKQRNLRAERASGGGSGSGGGGGGREEEKREVEVCWRGRLELLAGKRCGAAASSQFGSVAGSRQTSIGRGIDLAIAKGKASYAGGSSGGPVQPLSQGSIESQGGSSSSVSELESKALQGCSSGGELSPASIQSIQEGDAGSSGSRTTRTSGTDTEIPSKRADASGNQGKEIGMNAMEDMPCVFTIGDGPNGRRVDGILYKYGKGEEVRIMCVCHGSFLSPAEFVKHAGGSDVTHPLKHIVINPNPPCFR